MFGARDLGRGPLAPGWGGLAGLAGEDGGAKRGFDIRFASEEHEESVQVGRDKCCRMKGQAYGKGEKISGMVVLSIPPRLDVFENKTVEKIVRKCRWFERYHAYQRQTSTFPKTIPSTFKSRSTIAHVSRGWMSDAAAREAAKSELKMCEKRMAVASVGAGAEQRKDRRIWGESRAQKILPT